MSSVRFTAAAVLSCTVIAAALGAAGRSSATTRTVPGETVVEVNPAVQATPIRPVAPPEGWTHVTSIIDGDTVDVDKRYRVRLYGADAPDAGDSCGQEAIDTLRRLLTDKGRDYNVRLEYGSRRFESGVALAYLWVADDGPNSLIDEWMVRLGVASPQGNDGQYFNRITSAAQDAGPGCVR